MLARTLLLLLSCWLVACGGDEGGGSTGATGKTTPSVMLASGTTTLTLSSELRGLLRRGDVKARAIAPAERQGDTFRFQVSGGDVALPAARGVIRHPGGLRFRAMGMKLELRDIVIDTRKGVLRGRTRMGTLTLLQLDLSKGRKRREGGDVIIENIPATLSAEGAMRLRQRFNATAPLGLGPIDEGRSVGTVTLRLSGR